MTIRDYIEKIEMTDDSRSFLVSFYGNSDANVLHRYSRKEGYELILLDNESQTILGIQLTDKGYAPCIWGNLWHFIKVSAADIHRRKKGFYTENVWIISDYIKRIEKILCERYGLTAVKTK